MASTAGITISGLSSGLDTTSIINALTGASQKAVANVQAKEDTANTKLSDWQTFNANLLGLQSATTSLSNIAAYSGAAATSSNTTVATASASSGAAAGTHSLSVTTLAQNQQVLSGGKNDAATPLGYAGSFNLNGNAISVTASDTLASIASKINTAAVGVTAKVITVSPGNVKLSLSSNQSGSLNAISASDINGGTVLQQLGFVSASSTTAIRQSITTTSGATGAGSLAFSSASTKVGTLLNGGTVSTTAPSGTVQINGVSVALDLNQLSLNDVANKINAAGITGVTAQVVALPDANGNVNSSSKQQLQLVSASGAVTASSFTDANGVLASLGVVQSSYSNQVTGAQDASFSVDNIAYTRSSNNINDVIPNVGFTLLSAGTLAAPATSTISVSQDTTSAVNAVQNLVAAYNTVNQYVNNQNTFTPPTTANGSAATSPDLFGDYTLINIQQQLQRQFSTSIGGKSLGDIGITLGTDGTATVDTSKLTTALQTNATQVYQLFGASGTASDANVSFVSASSATVDSGGRGYAVNITQAASQGVITAGTAQTGATASPETLLFGGKAFGSQALSLTIPTSSSEQNIVDLINGNSTLNQLLYAAKDATSGKLVITSKAFGSSASFNVASDQAASATNSGIGTSALIGLGTDVAGTINGETATGLGKTLSGINGNKTTDGLVLNIAGGAVGNLGSVKVSHGFADQLSSLVNTLTVGSGSAIISAQDSLNKRVSDFETQKTQLKTELTNYTNQLNQQFAAMEQQLSVLKSQQTAFNSQTATTTTSSSSKTNTSG